MRKTTYNLYSWRNSAKQPSAEPLRDEFTSCSDLPMSRFIKITVTGDLTHLGRCEDPEKLWEKIHSEYTELSGDQQSSRSLELAKQISFLTNKINITNTIVQHLATRGNIPELVQELQNMGYRLKYDDLDKDLQRTLSLSKSDHIKLAVLREQYEKISTGEKTSEFNWAEIMAALAKHRGVMVINTALITVVDYICMDKEFRQHIAAMNKINK